MLSDGFTDEELDEARVEAGLRAKLHSVPTGAAVPGDWRERLIFERIKGGADRIAMHVANCVTILRHHPEWTWPDGSSRLHLDLHQQQVFVTQAPWSDLDAGAVVSDHPVPWTDADDTRLSAWLRRCQWGIKLSASECQQAVNVVAQSNCINPWQDYLDGLVWDGVPRLGNVLADYFGAEPGPYASSIFRWWLLSAVARTYRPGCKADYVLILEGSQGLKKSQALRTIAGRQWFSDTPISIGDKDAYVRLQGLVIVELAEFRIDSKAAKAFFSSDTDKFRPPYARRDIVQPRRCIFAATINPKGEYLNDPTGARRYWPIECRDVQLATLALVRDQLWAEAVCIFKAGLSCPMCQSGGAEWRCGEHRWWPESAEEHAVCGRQQEHRTHIDAWEEAIEGWCQARPEVTPLEVLTGALAMDKDKINHRAQERVAVILAALGYLRQAAEGGRTVRYKRQAR